MKRAALDLLIAAAKKREPAIFLTDLASGAADVFSRDRKAPELALSPAAIAGIEALLATAESGEIAIEDRRFFALVRQVPPRLIIVGAVHIAQALAPMAIATGYDVAIIDPRRAFATADRLPGLALSHAWPDEALSAMAPDRMSAILTLTHDPKLDDPALIVALRSPAFYIGALGSRKTQAARLDRLRQAGFAEEDLARIQGPAGFDIGATSPAEIAVAILAQLIAARRGKPSRR